MNPDGIVKKGKYVDQGDVIVGKITIKNKNDNSGTVDTSLTIKKGEEGFVDDVFVVTNSVGCKFIKIRIRKIKIPEPGDKFASREGQKGTIGLVLPQEDMPFTCDGVVPDLIINPHSQPSRMTVSQMLECLLGKSCVISGKYGDATPFTKFSKNPIPLMEQALVKYGYCRDGKESLTNGMTGELIKSRIFMGPTYYQRLKHIVSDKMHARSFGVLQKLVRQPVEGRSKAGGLKCGEMERDCMISQGISSFIKERMFDLSDKFKVVICKKCGTSMLTPDKCKLCDNTELVESNLPFACNLLFNELQAMGIKIRILTE